MVLRVWFTLSRNLSQRAKQWGSSSQEKWAEGIWLRVIFEDKREVSMCVHANRSDPVESETARRE